MIVIDDKFLADYSQRSLAHLAQRMSSQANLHIEIDVTIIYYISSTERESSEIKLHTLYSTIETRGKIERAFLSLSLVAANKYTCRSLNK